MRYSTEVNRIMIYLDTELSYPSNTIINDAANRSEYSKDAYSPIGSEIWDIIESYRMSSNSSRSAVYDYIKDRSHIMQSISYRDVDYGKIKGSLTGNIGDDGSFVTEEEIKRFENGTIKHIISYFKDAINVWRFNRNSDKGVSNVNTYGSLQFHDNADSDMFILPDELEVDDEFLEVEEETILVETVQKLIYYLKLLQEISSIKGYSVLQTLILIKKYGGNKSLIAEEGLYKININGEVVGRYAASANTSKGFIDWINLCNGNPQTEEDKRWVNIINQFKSICDSLNIDLGKEDPSNYSAAYINSQLSTYLASNEEYIDTVGRVDKTVWSMLEPDKLFATKNAVMGYDDSFANNTGFDKVLFRYQQVCAELDGMASWIDSMASVMFRKQQERLRDLFDVHEEIVENMLVFLLSRVGGLKTEEGAKKYYRRYFFFNSDCILGRSYEDKLNKEPTVFKIMAKTIKRFWGWPASEDVSCYVTMSGALLFLDVNKNIPVYITIKELFNGQAQVKDL